MEDLNSYTTEDLEKEIERRKKKSVPKKIEVFRNGILVLQMKNKRDHQLSWLEIILDKWMTAIDFLFHFTLSLVII